MIMKTRILAVILCLACVASFAQTSKKKPVKKPAAKKTATTKKPQTTPAPVVDTTKRPVVAAAPVKIMDRPLDGYYKKENILKAKVTPYASLRETDVAYAKRVW